MFVTGGIRVKRTTIFVEEGVLSILKQIAQEKNISQAEAIRQALEKYIGQQKTQDKPLSFTGIGNSGRDDIAEHHEHLLWTRET